jgi:hypothetical protein
VAAVTAFGDSRGWFGVANGSGFRSVFGLRTGPHLPTIAAFDVPARYCPSPPARRRRTELFQYGGPRFGDGAGTEVSSPVFAR